MSRLSTYFTNMVKTAFYTIQPNRVEEYPYEQYASEYDLFERVQEIYETFIFYKIANYYDMVYIPPATSLETPPKERRVFSLFRFQGDINDGLVTFRYFADVVQQMSQICANHDVKIDKLWLEKVTSLCRTHPKWTLAHLAAAINFPKAFTHENVSEFLNDQDPETGETPLHVAIKALSEETVRALLDLSATRLDVCDASGNTVLHAAVQANVPKLLEILLDFDTEETKPTEATNSAPSPPRMCKPTGFRNSTRVNIDQLNAIGESCLLLAVRGASDALVGMLLRAGASPFVGSTDLFPIHLAVEKEHFCCVDTLCSYYPAVVNMQTREKKLSVLHMAKTKQMFDHLLELGVDPNLRNSEGRTVLHEAVDAGKLDTVVQLLINAADTNLPDNRGVFPLHLAVARCQDVHIVYALIVFEADPNAMDVEGLSPRHWLCQHESNVYQRNQVRDTMLYALDVVQAQRCPPGRANCTAGCKAPPSGGGADGAASPRDLRRSARPADAATQEPISASQSPSPPPAAAASRGSLSFNYLSQLLQDMPFASNRDSADDIGELFNGIPPDPVLTNTNLTQDLDNDLFHFLAGAQAPSPSATSASASRCSSPLRRRSFNRPASPDLGGRTLRGSFYSSPAMTTVVEEEAAALCRPCDTNSSANEAPEPPPPVAATTASSTSDPPSEAAQSTYSWFRRTIVSRLLSVALPGLESLLSDEGSAPAPVVKAEEHEETPPRSEKAEAMEGERENILKDGSATVVEPRAPCSATIARPPSINTAVSRPLDFHYYSDVTGATRDDLRPCKLRLDDKASPSQPSPHHRHLCSRRSIEGCSGLPGVPCCMDREAKCLLHGEKGVALDASLPCNALTTLCDVSPTSPKQGEEENGGDDEDGVQRDSEGFRATRRGYRVLCLDGGGIRGLVLCQVLRAIERTAGRPIRELYDWIIGTSTGAMLALNLVQGKCVRYNRCLYFRLKEKIFVGNRPYPTEGLESLLREEFGETSVMSDIRDIRVSVTALRGDHFPPRLHMFRNYLAPFERMERLVSELIQARTPEGDPAASEPGTPTTVNQAEPSANNSDTAATSATSATASTNNVDRFEYTGVPYAVNTGVPNSPPSNTNTVATTEVPYKRLLTTFLRDLFGETLSEVGRGMDDESDLEESIVSLLTSFSRRYMYGSKGMEQPVPISEQPIWRAARASGAAPSYFRACGPYLDGGLIANNPTMDLLTEVQELNIVRRLRREPTVGIASVTSLGTGRVPLREVQQLDFFRPQNMSEAYRVALGVTELTRMLVEMATMSEGRIVERSRAWCSSLGVPFFRFSPLLSEYVALDTKDTRAILQMLWETEAYLCNCQERIRRLVDSLLAPGGDEDVEAMIPEQINNSAPAQQPQTP